ncbi:MAG TPA: hypothetical protein VK209_12905 [Candidatus Sulfotelmatobacter sp.]|jgi:hypothetical protein|nr:hypothetical protein [Candidatus Sulfotelmatobacter sp.]
MRRKGSVWLRAFIIFVTSYLSIVISQELSRLYPYVNATLIQALGPALAFVVVWFLFQKKLA